VSIRCNRVLMIVLLAVAALVSWPIENRVSAAEGAQPAQWRLIWTTDPATSATLAWSTSLAGKEHRVHLRQEGSDQVVAIEAYRNGRYSGKSPELYYHYVKFDDLQPATKYHVEIESDGNRSRSMFFITAPDEDVPFSILFGADSRSGLQERRKMNAMLSNMVTESYQGDRAPILAFVHAGDFIVNGLKLDQWSVWMSDHELTVGDDGRLLPIIPARGNHDVGEIFNEVFAFPAKEQTNYYAINLSPEVRMVTLNSETSIAGDQTKWLATELADSRPKNRWLLAQYHRPAFPAVKRPAISLLYWVPLFEEYNVDMACEGDGHNIKRTPPIRASKIDPTGVTYIGEGGLGVGQRTPDTERWYLRPPHAKTGSEHHVQLLTFDKEKLMYRVVLFGGEVFDEHTLAVRPAEQRAAKVSK